MTAPTLRGAVPLLLLGAAAGAACAEGDAPPRPGLAFQASLSLERPDGRPSRSFAVGEEVVLVLTVSNEADVRLSLPLGTAQTYDFTVSGPDGGELWRWSAGRRFAQVLGELALSPGEERRFRASWTARDADGAPVRPGRYRAAGWVGGTGSGVGVEAVEFRLE